MFSTSSIALNQRDEALLWVGVELFPVIAKSVKNPAFEQKPVALVYLHNAQQAEISAKQLEKFIPNPIEIVNMNQLIQNKEYGAVFLTHPDLQNARLVQHATRYNMLTFSPFYLAMQNGIDSGMVVKDQVRPLINLKQIRAKHILFKPFFLRVAQTYE
jgi:hypothetical protein